MPIERVPLFSPDWESAWLLRVNDDAEFRLTSRWTVAPIRLILDSDAYHYKVDRSRFVVDAASGGDVPTLAGSADAWRDYLAPCPTPPNHHVLGMDRRRSDFQIAAGREAFIRNLRVFSLLLDYMRDTSSEPQQ